ncbi:pentapeptide repeat-containing protein, partial [Siccibacter turicensis]|uniref:pentapeptide repeat-containing protein n=1 Tax=Siccibacter turicensis TaxID=357233 RepID=UPI001C627A19
MLNVGSGISGWYNTSTLGAGTPAVVSGIGNLGQQLSGLLANGTVLNRSPIVNIGWDDVGAFNTGLGNVGDLNWGAANIGAQNLGLGNLGSGNVGFGNIGAGNFGLFNSGSFN